MKNFKEFENSDGQKIMLSYSAIFKIPYLKLW